MHWLKVLYLLVEAAIAAQIAQLQIFQNYEMPLATYNTGIKYNIAVDIIYGANLLATIFNYKIFSKLTEIQENIYP